jgi:hypothetical protein
MPEAVAKLENYVTQRERKHDQPRDHYNVVVCAQRVQFDRIASDRLRWTDTWEEGDFFIAPTHMDCDNMLDGKVIATIERMGVVIGVVKDRRGLIGKGNKRRRSLSGFRSQPSVRVFLEYGIDASAPRPMEFLQ